LYTALVLQLYQSEKQIKLPDLSFPLLLALDSPIQQVQQSELRVLEALVALVALVVEPKVLQTTSRGPKPKVAKLAAVGKPEQVA
jgi:hypothetical protein